MISIETILVPTDFSACAWVALRYAVGLAARVGANVELLHVVDRHGYAWTDAGDGGGPIPGGPSAMAQVARIRAEEQLDVVLRTLGRDAARDLERAGFEVTTHVEFGPPADTVVERVRAAGVDLVVMGTHGRRPLSRMALGSVADVVVRRSPAPVLTLRQDFAGFRTSGAPVRSTG